MTRQYLNCPATEAHEQHMANLKAIGGPDQVLAYLDRIRRDEGAFFARWARDEFATWWQTQQRQARNMRRAA